MFTSNSLLLFPLIFLMALAGAPRASAAPLTTVPFVDLTRYMGKWYEIAAIPQDFQRQCVSGTTAEYEILEKNLVRVVNSCETENHSRSVSEGRAKVTDKKTNAKLKVTFAHIGDKYFFAFGGKYWITYLDPDYRFAIVGHPDRKYGWILARDPAIAQSDLQILALELKIREYDTCQFIITPHKNGYQTKSRLCDVATMDTLHMDPE